MYYLESIIDNLFKLFFVMAKSVDTIVTGIGFAADSYDLFVIGLVIVILKHLYPESDTQASIVATTSLVGAIIGQLLFGYIALKVGRVKPFIVTLSLIIIGAFVSAFMVDNKHVSIFISLAIIRLIMGIGIGGEYPLSATITKEKNTSNRPTVAVFSMQGIGYLFSALMFLAIIYWIPLNIAWRVLLFFGGIPGAATIYWRFKMHETQDFEELDSHKIGWSDIKTNFVTLLGTAGSWFLFDITFYGNGIFASSILDDMISGDIYVKTTHTALFNLVIAAISLLGYLCAWYTIDKFPKKLQQIIGFICIAVVFFVIGGTYNHIKSNIYIFTVLYGLTFFFANFGPNTTTFVYPTVVFEPKVRPTFHGISAAAGKLGAVVGAAFIKPISTAYGIEVIMYISAIISLIGAVWSLLLPKDKKYNDYIIIP